MDARNKQLSTEEILGCMKDILVARGKTPEEVEAIFRLVQNIPWGNLQYTPSKSELQAVRQVLSAADIIYICPDCSAQVIPEDGFWMCFTCGWNKKQT